MYYQKLKQKKTFQDFRVFNFGYRGKAKLGNLRNCFFFLIKPHNFIVSFFFVIFQFLDLLFHIQPKNEVKYKLQMCQTISIYQQHLKFLVTEIFKSTSSLNPQFKWSSFTYKEIPHNLRDNTLMTSMKIVQFSRPRPLPSPLPYPATSKILPSLWPWTSNLKRAPTPISKW